MKTPRVLLVSKRVCPLCDEAKHALESARKQVAFELEVRLIDEDAELRERHALEVPVVFIDGERKFFGKVSALMLIRELRIAARIV